MFHGEGTMYYPNDNKFYGTYEKGIKHGDGTMIINNNQYVG